MSVERLARKRRCRCLILIQSLLIRLLLGNL
jgi:hypothetical protein